MEEIEDWLLEAREELKRLEHIIYVSLKYTRTVDVILNALNRIISTFDIVIETFLEKAKEDNLIEAIPKSPALRATRVAEFYTEDQELQNYLHFYSFLKTVLNLPYQKREEYRRHVTLIVKLENSTVEVNIDNLINCERYIHNFYTHSWNVLVGKPEEDDL